SSRERGSDHAQLGDQRKRRRPAENVEAVLLDPVERRAIEAGKGRDAGGAPAGQVGEQGQPLGEVRSRPLGLKAHELAPLGGDEPASDVGLLDAETSELVLRQVDAAEGPVLGDIANDVDQLQGDAERLGPLRLVGSVNRDAGAPDRAGDAHAVSAQLVEIDIARLLRVLDAAVDQRQERVCRDRESLPGVGERDEPPLPAMRASRTRDGLGRPEKTSKWTRSSASTAASPPRAKAVTARPVRPPSLRPSGSPAERSPRARPASNWSSCRSGSFGRSSSVTPK